MQAGLDSFTLSDGKQIGYEEKLNSSVKDQEKLTKFLEERGDDGIIKCSLELGRIPQNVLNKIVQELADKYDLVPDVKTGVHHSTLTSYFSTLCGIKKGTTAEIPIGQIDETMVTLYTFYKTTIK